MGSTENRILADLGQSSPVWTQPNHGLQSPVVVGTPISFENGPQPIAGWPSEPGLTNGQPIAGWPPSGPATIPTSDHTISFQEAVNQWVKTTFGTETLGDVKVRRQRFLEEALELVQATGGTPQEVANATTYVFSRPVGEVNNEVGGTLNTLSALCTSIGVNLMQAAWDELISAWNRIDQIRVKSAGKPVF